MLNVVLDDWMKKGVTGKHDFIFCASKQYPSSSLLDNIYYPTLYVSFIR